jgi:transposase-like protein
MEKQDAIKLSTEAQQGLRSLAIKLKNSGRTYAEISKTIDVHPSTICAWYKI